ncbi:hypothetical protein [Halobellus captivus]|uniref:hypothetical protein n=1 Tax=Halobellus captivus TaxID=2592614 RepID=UPI00119D6CBA|nr:hypothetical protein [Halobellus captivus]
MPSTPSRRDALRFCGSAVAFSTAGCLGSPTDTTPVSNSDAEDRALAAEADHIRSRLENASCVDEWGLTSYTGVETEASVTDRTAEGIHVEVAHPYWYSTEEIEADVGSNARYVISERETRRADGDDVSPC